MKQLCEACILAGGLSTRMGQDKARLRLGSRSFLAHIRAAAREAELPVRVIRRDSVPRCGPIGGIYTALSTTKAQMVLFLSCDMPLVRANLLRRVMTKFDPQSQALFIRERGAGFPCLIHVRALEEIRALLQEGARSLQALASRLKSQSYTPTPEEQADLVNVNTPEEYVAVRRFWQERRQASR